MLEVLMFLGLWVAVGVAVLLGWTPDSRDGDGWVSREQSWRRELTAPRRH